MKVILIGEPKEIADLAVLVQCRHKIRREPYSTEIEVVPVLENGGTSANQSSETDE